MLTADAALFSPAVFRLPPPQNNALEFGLERRATAAEASFQNAKLNSHHPRPYLNKMKIQITTGM